MNTAALITGSDRNIGWEIARTLASQGRPVVIHALAETAAHAALDALRDAVPDATATCTWFDLGSPTAIGEAWERLDGDGVRVGALVNNAADQGMATGVLLDVDQFESVFDVNVLGLAHNSKQFATRVMDRAESGVIVNMSSLAGTRGIVGRAAYSSSKAAVDGLTRGFALDLAPHGIVVNSIAAGYVDSARWADLPAEAVSRRLANIPVGAATAPQEIATLVAMLTSGLLPTMTGSTLTIDGALGIQQVPADCVR